MRWLLGDGGIVAGAFADALITPLSGSEVHRAGGAVCSRDALCPLWDLRVLMVDGVTCGS